MKYILLLLLYATNVFAAEILIDTVPKKPFMGEGFKLTFEVSMESQVEPIITFEPYNLDVISKSNTGVSTRTTYANGKLSVERKMTVTYEVMPKKAGPAYIKNIYVKVDDKEVRHPLYKINILKSAPRSREIFVEADISNKNPYVGESVVVKYFLYSKVRLSNFEIKKFPKLNKWLKRYHQDSQSRAERVEYNGELYTRRAIYTVQLFPETPGNYYVDPITLGVQYYGSNRRNYGFGFGQIRSRSPMSEKIKINVLPLPIDSLAQNFTGLVGNHKFKLKVNKSKFLVNEPIEIDFEVTGDGALELFEQPEILVNPSLETFDATSDFEIRKDFTAKKKFKITYLGRDQVTIPPSKINFSYYDLVQNKYVTESLPFPGIKVLGGAIQQTQKPRKNTSISNNIDNNIEDKRDFTPLFKLKNTYVVNRGLMLTVLVALLFCFLFFFLFIKVKAYIGNKKSSSLSLYANGISYGDLIELTMNLSEGSSVVDKIDNSNLTKSDKDYLLKIVARFEEGFKTESSSKKYKIRKDVLRELLNANS